jgi:hypothetical protein
MPRLQKGNALSLLNVVPISPGFASLALAHIIETSSMKIGSSPLLR